MNSKNDNYIELFLQDPNYYVGQDWKIYTNRPTSGPIGKKVYPWRNIVRINDKGYEFFTYKSKYLKVHRVVYRFYYGYIDERTINHIDGDKLNNDPKNLELIDIYENIQHAVDTGLYQCGEECSHSVLTENDVVQIKKLIKTYNDNYIAKLYNMSRHAIIRIRLGQSWKHVK